MKKSAKLFTSAFLVIVLIPLIAGVCYAAGYVGGAPGAFIVFSLIIAAGLTVSYRKFAATHMGDQKKEVV
jgi:hypothetical protein